MKGKKTMPHEERLVIPATQVNVPTVTRELLRVQREKAIEFIREQMRRCNRELDEWNDLLINLEGGEL